MSARFCPWDLPGLAGWLEDLADQLGRGILLLPPMPGAPAGLVDALLALCGGLHDRQVISCDSAATRAPAEILAEALGCAPSLEVLASSVCDQRLVILHLAEEASAPWQTFLDRLTRARREAPGLSLLVPDAPAALRGCGLPCAGDWRSSLSRGDRVIWAEEHLPRNRSGLAAEFAVALAVELCGWRLDLAAELARASLDHLTRPLDWLALRTEPPVPGPQTEDQEPCPLALRCDGLDDRLHRRVWRAQLASLFPRLEEIRLDLIDCHRGRLRLDPRQRELGVGSIEEIELGGLQYQLRGVLDRTAADRLAALARLRNCLAHRRMADPDDCRALLTWDGRQTNAKRQRSP